MLCWHIFLAAFTCSAPSAVALSIDQYSQPLRAAEEEGLDIPGGAAGLYEVEDQAAFDRKLARVWDDVHAQVAQEPVGHNCSRRMRTRKLCGTRQAKIWEQRAKKRMKINIVISVLQNAVLPSWCESVINGSWGKDVSLTVYMKSDELDDDEHHSWLYSQDTQSIVKTENRAYHGDNWTGMQQRTYYSSDRFEMILIPNVGRNEHAFVWHMMRKAPSFADVEIYTKTNGQNKQKMESMIKYMVDVARNGTHGFVSYPWERDRRYLLLRCDPLWVNHPLYEDLCKRDGSARSRSKPSMELNTNKPSMATETNKERGDKIIYTKNYKYGHEALHVRRATIMPLLGATATLAETVPLWQKLPEQTDLSWVLGQLPQPLPLVHETYGEGMFAVRRDVLNAVPASWYTIMKNLTYKANWNREKYDGVHHDGAMMEVLPLLFDQLDAEVKHFPAWFVSKGTVDLFDTVDMTNQFNEADRDTVIWAAAAAADVRRHNHRRRHSVAAALDAAALDALDVAAALNVPGRFPSKTPLPSTEARPRSHD